MPVGLLFKTCFFLCQLDWSGQLLLQLGKLRRRPAVPGAGGGALLGPACTTMPGILSLFVLFKKILWLQTYRNVGSL